MAAYPAMHVQPGQSFLKCGATYCPRGSMPKLLWWGPLGAHGIIHSHNFPRRYSLALVAVGVDRSDLQ